MADTRGIRELARKWLLELIIKEGKANHRFLHSFYAYGDKEQILGCYGKAILEDFNQIIKLAEIAEFMAAFAESIVEQCCKVAEDPKIWKKFADKDGKPASMSNLTVAGLAVARAIRSRWQRGEGK